MRTGDGVVALDVRSSDGIQRSTHVAARDLAVPLHAAREPGRVRRLDPDAHVVVVAEHPVERADPLHDDDPSG